MVRKRGLPKWSELVLVTVEKLSPYAAWCKLIEYPGVEGMIHVSEVAGKWVHDIRDFIKINKQYVAKVIKVDYQKNFVNLSLKRVSKQDEKEKMNFFRKEQRAEKLLER
ncbi:MAG: S1 RNA-binding domain-containing protein, partial [Candidatus Aenigmatarchaeota archaeon]